MHTSLTGSSFIIPSSLPPDLLLSPPPSFVLPLTFSSRQPSSFGPSDRPLALIRRHPNRKVGRKRRSGNPGEKMTASATSYRSGSDEYHGILMETIDREMPLIGESRNCSASSQHQQIPEYDKSAIRDDERKEQSHGSNFLHKRMSFMKNIKCFGVEMSPDTIAVAMVYFVQGVLGLSRLAVSFYFKDDLHLDPAETAVITGFSALPWLIKPLYGFISDSFPLFGYRRRSYLVLSGFLGALSWGTMATFVDSKYSAGFCILLGSLSVAFSDVVVDSMVVERARGETQSTSGSLQSLCWGSSALGGIISAYFSGSLVGTYGPRFVFGVTAFLPLMTSAVALLVKEKVVHDPTSGHDFSVKSSSFVQSSKQQIMQLWNTVRQPNILFPTLFIFLWQATPQSDSAMFFFTTNKLGFTPEFLGRVKLVTSIASLMGVALYNGFLKNVPLRRVFLLMTIMGAGLGMTQVLLVTGLNRHFGVSDEWFAIGDSLILTVLGQASFMPVLVLAARLCPPGVEATLFATLMSISNGASVTGGLIGAGLTQLFGITKDSFTNLSLLIILCNLSSLLPLPLLGLLPKENPDASSVIDPESALQNMDEMKLK